MTVSRLLLLPLALLCALAPSTFALAAPASPPGTARLTASIDAYLTPLVRIDAFQGVVLVARGDHVLVQKGYGWADAELRVPNTPERIFRIASLSKPFTQVALGTLVDAGKLRLSDPLSRFLPDFPSADSITIEELRTHRAGIPGRNSLPYDEEADAPTTLDSLVHALARMPLDFAPGTKTRYSNGGYALLAAIIERASGMSYADYVATAVCTPLGLAHTRHEADGDRVDDRALGYATDPTARRGLVPAAYQQMATKTGGGSLVSTALDLHRFLRALHRAPVLRDGTWNALFPPDTIDAFQGRCPGYNSYVVRDYAHDLDVVVLANDYSSGMVARIGDDLLALARGRRVETATWRADVPLDPADASELVGTWRAKERGSPIGQEPCTIARRGTALVLAYHGAPVDALLPQGHGEYLLRALWSTVNVERAQGDPLRVTMHPMWYRHAPVALERVPAP
jgi:CubicO group peptidase (beta-lactamase class C family)